jgi:hypothetical protein
MLPHAMSELILPHPRILDNEHIILLKMYLVMNIGRKTKKTLPVQVD